MALGALAPSPASMAWLQAPPHIPPPRHGPTGAPSEVRVASQLQWQKLFGDAHPQLLDMCIHKAAAPAYYTIALQVHWAGAVAAAINQHRVASFTLRATIKGNSLSHMHSQATQKGGDNDAHSMVAGKIMHNTAPYIVRCGSSFVSCHTWHSGPGW